MTPTEKGPALICIVDDDEAVSGAIGNFLRASGYQTQIFHSAEALLEVYQTQEIDCLVVDVNMPGMGGLEPQRRLTEMNVSVPILFVSGNRTAG